MELSRKDNIKKDHNKYIHTIVMQYPIANVIKMRKDWRKSLDDYSDWLTNYDERIESALNDGYAMIDKEAEMAKEEVIRELAKSDEELFKDFKKRHLEFIQEKQTFVDEKQKRKEDLKKEIMTQMEVLKKDVTTKAKQKRDALKLWTDNDSE